MTENYKEGEWFAKPSTKKSVTFLRYETCFDLFHSCLYTISLHMFS